MLLIGFRAANGGLTVVSAANPLPVTGGGGGGGGDASAANQVTGNASLASIDTKLTDQATAAGQAAIVSAIGTIPSATEYAEDTPLPPNPQGGSVILRRRDTLTAAEVSADGDGIAWNATDKGEGHVHDADVLAKLSETVPALPPRMVGGLNTAVTTVAVDKADTGADTIQGADTDEAWQMASCKLTVSGATTLTFDSGGIDLILDIPGPGLLDLQYDESGHNTGADNTPFLLTSSAAVDISGVIKLQKV